MEQIVKEAWGLFDKKTNQLSCITFDTASEAKYNRTTLSEEPVRVSIVYEKPEAVSPKKSNSGKTKEKLLGIKGTYGSGGTESYDGLKAETLRELIELGYADPEEQQNESPTIARFLEFMEKYPFVTAHGYAVGPQRDDERVSIEGVSASGGKWPKQFPIDFTAMFRFADDFTLTSKEAYCWYD